jgi:4-hydroxy-4-methyl-2-oxoglutarate aldolase
VGTYPRRSRSTFSFGSLGEPLDLGGVRVCTGDIIVGDASGVVCVPRELAERTLELAAGIQATEEALLDQIRSNTVVDWDAV